MMSGGTFLEGGRPAGNAPGVYSLKWNSFQLHITKGLSKLLDDNSYTDVTLACEGSFLKAHKLLLSLCSPFFKRLFEANDLGKSNKSTIVILNNVRFKDLENIIRFIYNGQTNVNQADLNNFLETGELLQIEGLASCSTNQNNQNQNEGSGTSFGSNNTTLTTAPQLPPLPTLQSYPPRVTTTSNMTTGTTNPSAMMDSRLRATLTNTSPQNFHSHSQGLNSMQPKPSFQTQQQLPPPKRPRLLNMGPESSISSGPVSRLQSILTGQSYSSPSGVTPKPVHVQMQQNSVRTSPAPTPVVIVERDPLEQDDDVIHLDEEPDNIECEPMIAINSVKSMADSIQVYSLDDDGDGKPDENITEGEEDEFEDSHQDMIDHESDNQDLYHENMEMAGRNKSGPSTSQSGLAQKQGTGSAARTVVGASVKKSGRKPSKHKYRACTYCGGLFYRSNLSRHMSQVHAQILLAQGKRLFRCGVCRTLYRSTGHLQSHMQKQHGDHPESRS